MSHTQYDEDLDAPIWGAEAIGKALNLTERQAYHLLHTNKLPAKKIGAKHVSTKRQLMAAVAFDETA